MNQQQEEKVFTREALWKSKRFSHIQQDFLKAILQKESYTIAEAEEAIAQALGGEQ